MTYAVTLSPHLHNFIAASKPMRKEAREKEGNPEYVFGIPPQLKLELGSCSQSVPRCGMASESIIFRQSEGKVWRSFSESVRNPHYVHCKTYRLQAAWTFVVAFS